MINIGFGPNIILGFALGFGVILLYLLRLVKPEVARDEDIFFATIVLLYSCILIIHGWRLDPILLFSQVLIITSLLGAGWENIRLRGLLYNIVKFKNKKLGFKLANNFSKTMSKKYSLFWILLLILINCFSLFVDYSVAIDLDEATRTVTLDISGNTTVLSPEQVKRGKRLFNATCGACHVGGITKTNPNVGLDPEALSLATPRRDNIVSLVDYMKNPVTYDGLESIAEVHPSIKSADLYPRMRSITDEDLYSIAGHIMLQPKIVTEKWGGGKIYY